MKCKHKNFSYNFYFGWQEDLKHRIEIMKRCADCGFLLDQVSLRSLKVKELEKIYKIVKNKEKI